jgi:hypothetical protein
MTDILRDLMPASEMAAFRGDPKVALFHRVSEDM